MRIAAAIFALAMVSIQLAIVQPAAGSGGSSGAKYYVDSVNGSDSGDGSQRRPWKSLTKVPALNPDDQVLLATGSRFSSLAIRASGAAGRPISYDSYGPGAPPIIGDGTSSLLISGNSVVIQHCDLQGKAVISNASDVVLANNLVRNSSGPGVQVVGASVALYNNTIVNNAGFAVQMIDGIQPATVTALNNAIVGNGFGGGVGVLVSAGGRFTYDYNLISGNGKPFAPARSLEAIAAWNVGPAGCAPPRCADGGHNLPFDLLPGFTSWANGTAYFTLTVDGDMYRPSYWKHLDDMLPADVPFTVFATHISLIPGGELRDVANIFKSGNELAVHGWSHSKLDASTAVRITTSNANPRVVVDPVTKKLTLSTSTPGNSVTIDWSKREQDISDLKKALDPAYRAYSNTDVTGKGWTIQLEPVGNSNGIKDDMRLKALAAADSTAFPYSLPLDATAFYNAEIAEVVAWAQAQTGVAPTTMAYPIGSFYRAPGMATYLRDTVRLRGARDSTVGDGWLGSVRIYETQGWTLYHMQGDSSDATMQRVARHEYVRCTMSGLICNYIWHSGNDIADAPLLAFVNGIRSLGGKFSTYRDVVDAIRADHTTTDGLTFTKTYPDRGNYTLQANSPAIDAGSRLPGAYRMALSPSGGTVDQNTLGKGWEIGAYAFAAGDKPSPQPRSAIH
ncbi:MAG: right-handed parallel beta-helix repeat-containing protein [Terriglobales bacterium]